MKIISSMAVVLAFVALPGCGSSASSACSKAEECATKAGTTFSQTECETQVITAREKADSVNCGAEFDDAASCVSDLACGAGSEEVNANCGAPEKTLSTCMKASAGVGSGSAGVGSGSAGAGGVDDCTRASDAVLAKLASCPNYTPSSSGPGVSIQCTAALGMLDLCQSDCVQATSCACLGLGSPQECSSQESSSFSNCIAHCQ